MTRQCHNVYETVTQEVLRPVERWEKRTEKRCKKYHWWDPRGWFCWLVAWFVKIVTYVAEAVTWVVTKVVCEIVANVLNAAAFVVGLILSIPFFGPIAKAILRVWAEAISQWLGLLDMLARLFGLRITKHLRICIVILNDDRLGVVQPSELNAAISYAQDTFYRGAKVRLSVNSIRTVDKPSPRDNLDVDANAGAVWNELWAPGSYFETAANGYCLDDAFSRLVPIGGPVVVFVVRSVAGQKTGCSLAFLTDYITVERALFRNPDGPAASPTTDPTVLAHELGHACSLPHVDGRQNLMYPSSSPGSLRGNTLEAWQVSLIRGSRHVTFV